MDWLKNETYGQSIKWFNKADLDSKLYKVWALASVGR